MSAKKARPSALARTFAWPSAIALVSIVGLVSALVADGPGDWLSWAALAVPLAALAWAWVRRS